jgi:hypothetical protein
MLQQGMSADEIVKVVAATAADSPAELEAARHRSVEPEACVTRHK